MVPSEVQLVFDEARRLTRRCWRPVSLSSSSIRDDGPGRTGATCIAAGQGRRGSKGGGAAQLRAVNKAPDRADGRLSSQEPRIRWPDCASTMRDVACTRTGNSARLDVRSAARAPLQTTPTASKRARLFMSEAPRSRAQGAPSNCVLIQRETPSNRVDRKLMPCLARATSAQAEFTLRTRQRHNESRREHLTVQTRGVRDGQVGPATGRLGRRSTASSSRAAQASEPAQSKNEAV